MIPDILANAGGVVGSYFEWLQSRQHHYWAARTFDRRVEETMTGAATAVALRAARDHISLRDAAMHTAVESVARATLASGL